MEAPVRLSNICGYEKRSNDLIYISPKSEPDSSVVVYFPGDVQDYTELMESHQYNKNHVAWNLESTARLLNNKFPKSHTVVVRPSRMELNTFSCFDNFVPCNKFGVPDHVPMNCALKHLECLLQNLTEVLRQQNTRDSKLSLEQMNLHLIGFSKGCVVLNQFVNEFHHLKTKNVENGRIGSFVERIEAIYWLDGGHSGGKNTWITARSLLETLASLGIDIHIHVTPYQIRDERRPWIREEEKVFYKRLKELGAPITRVVHFANDDANLDNHFKVLDVFKDDVT